MKKTMEEILEDQGIEQSNIFDILYPERKNGNSYEKYNDRFEQPSIRTDGTSE